jgi:hypothetical protein
MISALYCAVMSSLSGVAWDRYLWKCDYQLSRQIFYIANGDIDADQLEPRRGILYKVERRGTRAICEENYFLLRVLEYYHEERAGKQALMTMAETNILSADFFISFLSRRSLEENISSVMPV